MKTGEGKQAEAAEAQVEAVDYDNSLIELMVLKQVRQEFLTAEEQIAELTRRINEFANKPLENKQVPTGGFNKRGREIVKTISGAKNDVLDIMCLAQLLFEGGNKAVMLDMQDIISKIQRNHLMGISEVTHSENLAYLQKCLTSFKPTIYQNIKQHFAEQYGVSPELVQCTPKTDGKQVGAKVFVQSHTEDENPKIFYVKSHQEFCSKSDPQLMVITSDGVGAVDFKELFMYKVLEKIGYAPKTQFIVSRDVARSKVDEGILIATQDSGYTKTPGVKNKTFKTFGSIQAEIIAMGAEAVSDQMRKDITAIDMLSRAFLLGDIIVNSGNFGRVDREVKTEEGNALLPEKWKIVDFFSPKKLQGRETSYTYQGYYPAGVPIFHAFKTGNASHTYNSGTGEIIGQILSAKRTQALWEEVVNDFESGKGGRKKAVFNAIDESVAEIMILMTENQEVLDIKPERLARREADLALYSEQIKGNFAELIQGVREDRQASLAQGEATAK
ncbi:MAG: hypothetical protein HON23_02245 [Rickettsiales bacterium]|jgi:hypothetical protein|nr:hypothetical protein [Rickettsiales bacterium]